VKSSSKEDGVFEREPKQIASLIYVVVVLFFFQMLKRTKLKLRYLLRALRTFFTPKTHKL